MNLALDLTKEMLKADGIDWQSADGVEVHKAMRHAETALIFIARNMERYTEMEAKLALARPCPELGGFCK